MWETLKVYKQLDKADINPTFKKFGISLVSLVEGYSISQTGSVIKLFRNVNQLEQAVFIERDKSSYSLKVSTTIKPLDFYLHHKFTMINKVSVGDILNNHRKTTYPLTQEWNDLAIYLATIIKSEIQHYFQKYNSYEKIIEKRKEIEPKDVGFDNKYELLIFAAIKTRNKELLIKYLDNKLKLPVTAITQAEYLKGDKQEINVQDFLQSLRLLASKGDFTEIDSYIAGIKGRI